MSRNISIYVISAICGNWWIESGINSGIYESLVPTPPDFIYHDNMGGFGLGQWTNVGSSTGRRWRLHEYLSGRGLAEDSFTGQIDFLFDEAYWTPKPQYGYGEFNTLDEFLASTSTDIEYLTHTYNYCWEGIRNDTWDLRVQRANEVYQYLLTHKEDSVTPIIGNRYLSVDERLNNSVCVFQYIGNGVVPPTPPTPIDLMNILPAIISSKRKRKEL